MQNHFENLKEDIRPDRQILRGALDRIPSSPARSFVFGKLAFAFAGAAMIVLFFVSRPSVQPVSSLAAVLDEKEMNSEELAMQDAFAQVDQTFAQETNTPLQ